MSRRIERVIAWTAIVVAASVAAFALLWHFAWNDDYWRLPLPSFHPFTPIAYFTWMSLACIAAALIEIAVAIVLGIRRGRRAAGRWLLVSLPLLLSVLTPLWMPPLAGLDIRGVDRLRGETIKPIAGVQLLARMVAITCAMSALACMSALMRHTREVTRAALRVVTAIVCAMVISSLYVLYITPATYEWLPFQLQGAADRYVAFVPCRGATVWAGGAPNAASPRWVPIAYVDDLWLRFDDPRAAAPVRAVSLAGTWRDHEYRWLALDETSPFRVRRDDPHVIHCDQRWRTERVAPESWHKLGPDIW